MEEITLVDPRETENTKPLEKVAPVSIHLDYQDCHVMIQTELTKELRSTLVEFLKKNYDIFALSQGDVPGIDSQIAVHKLFIDSNHSLVHQRRIKFALEHLKVIEEEVAKLVKVNIIKESHYPNWLVDVIVAPQKGGKIENVCRFH